MAEALDRLVLFSARRGNRRRKWTRAEVARLHGWVGKLLPSEMARRLNRRQRAVVSKLYALGYRQTADVMLPMGITAIGLAAQLDIPYEVILGDVHRNLLPATKEGGKDYTVRWTHVARYQRRLAARESRRQKYLDRIHERTISKPEFERLIGLSETQSQRYLVGKIVRAWKIPCRWQDSAESRWEWRVSLACARRARRRRASGRLRLAHPAYRHLQRRQSREIMRLRRAHRLDLRDDLHKYRSSVRPGHYTLTQVASHVGLCVQAVYGHVRLGRLKTCRILVGRRAFHAVPPSALPAYLAWCRRERVATGPLHPRQREIVAVHAAGCLTLSEAARRYRLSYRTLAWRIQTGAIPAIHVGRMLGVHLIDVRRWVKNLRRGKYVYVHTR